MHVPLPPLSILPESDAKAMEKGVAIHPSKKKKSSIAGEEVGPLLLGKIM